MSNKKLKIVCVNCDSLIVKAFTKKKAFDEWCILRNLKYKQYTYQGEKKINKYELEDGTDEEYSTWNVYYNVKINPID